ncbi:selenium metabolism-associated LysR family transcriptional regulator [Desulfitobacterium metallireducens]|uniref:LysR family transcriptional regulator n=1 Tax=Desulfitobacterium metallireducens DSM 15288 TaxID=871968 RepID=W0EBP7_9FIRM|nr:selenium metabolism-associated LysR family transcriptional regulator [Desulfitobacterium metallireducens]AHF06629.1 LysR family transcriptional regulator [Desulfitobacterium metallireducens DSM 15288]
MDSYQLKIFCTVTRAQSFSKAAKLLHMSQPAVSTHIKNMEEYYQGVLFERTPHGVILTKAGEVFYDYAQKILDLHDEMEQQLESVLLRKSHQIIVGASTTIGNVSLPCSIYLFKEEYPEVSIRLEIANSDEILRKLMVNEVNIGVFEGHHESPDLNAIPVTSDELVLIASPHHSKEEGSISIENFLKRPLILREDGSGTRKILADALERHGHNINDLNVITEMTTIDAIKSAVEAGLGEAIVPRLAVRKEAYLGTLKVLKITGMEMPLDFNIIYPSQRSLSTAAKRFIRFLSDPEERYLC